MLSVGALFTSSAAVDVGFTAVQRAVSAPGNAADLVDTIRIRECQVAIGLDGTGLTLGATWATTAAILECFESVLDTIRTRRGCTSSVGAGRRVFRTDARIAITRTLARRVCGAAFRAIPSAVNAHFGAVLDIVNAGRWLA